MSTQAQRLPQVRTKTPSAAGGEARSPGRFPRPTFNGWMLAPALALLALLSLFPFFYMILMSLSRVGLLGGIQLSWAGFDNWTRLFTDSAVGEPRMSPEKSPTSRRR